MPTGTRVPSGSKEVGPAFLEPALDWSAEGRTIEPVEDLLGFFLPRGGSFDDTDFHPTFGNMAQKPASNWGDTGRGRVAGRITYENQGHQGRIKPEVIRVTRGGLARIYREPPLKDSRRTPRLRLWHPSAAPTAEPNPPPATHGYAKCVPAPPIRDPRHRPTRPSTPGSRPSAAPSHPSTPDPRPSAAPFPSLNPRSATLGCVPGTPAPLQPRAGGDLGEISARSGLRAAV